MSTSYFNGKKCEVPVKKILAGIPADKAISRDALHKPHALGPFLTQVAE